MKLLPARRLWPLYFVITGLFLSTIACRLRFDAVEEAQYLDVEWSPTGELLAVGGTEGLQVFDSQLEQVYEVQDEWISDVTWNPKGSLLAIVSEASSLAFIRADSNNFNEVQRISIPGLQLAAWSSDGTKIGVVVRHSFDQYALRIYRASAEEHEQQITISELFSSSDYSKQITSLDWDSSGRYLAAVNRNPIVYIVDSVNGTVIASADYSSEDSTAYVADVTIDWHPVDTLLGIQQRNMPIDILSTQGEIQTSNTPSLGTDFVWDNAGDRVIIVTNQSVEFRDLETGNIEQTLEEFDGFVEKIALQPVGTIMAGVGSMRGGRLQVWLWDVDSGQIVATLE